MRTLLLSVALSTRVPVVFARVRLVLAVAGVAWLVGYTPGLAGRLAAVLVALVVLALDYVAGSTGRQAGGSP